MGGVSDRDMVVCRGGNNRSGVGNNWSGVGNNCWGVMVVNSQSSSLGNRGVHGNGSRGSMHCGVADMTNSMANMAESVADMTNSVGDDCGRCMHCGMPDPVGDNWSNGNGGGNWLNNSRG